MNKAFTLLELVFVILILGILSSLSLSFINTTKDEVKILKLKMDYLSLFL
ncbi:prepilin-type N-terminal cleavage/methylation domain-containing protein [Campylobacter jejuni]|nr:prepilin-type N-terminal cleavage/methylation domain-containing protein [Campylobacter jejuni]